MNEVAGKASITGDQSEHVGRCEPRRTVLLDRRCVDSVVRIQDQSLVVDLLECRICPCDIEKFLRQEGEVLRMP